MDKLEAQLNNIPKGRLSRRGDFKIRLEIYSYLLIKRIGAIALSFKSVQMQKVAAIILIIVVFSSTSAFAYASESVTYGEVLYPLKKNLEKVEKAMTVSPEKKASLNSKLALKRLAEAEHIMKETGKKSSSSLDITLKEAVKEMNSAETEIEKVVKKSDSDLLSASEKQEKQIVLLKRIASEIELDEQSEAVDQIALALNSAKRQNEKTKSLMINGKQDDTDRKEDKPKEASTTETLILIKSEVTDYKEELQGKDLPKEKVEKLIKRIDKKLLQAEESLKEGNLNKFQGLIKATDALRNNGDDFLKQADKKGSQGDNHRREAEKLRSEAQQKREAAEKIRENKRNGKMEK